MAAEITFVSSALKTRLLAFAFSQFPKFPKDIIFLISQRHYLLQKGLDLLNIIAKKPARKVTNLPTYLI